jgi:hypothetical protein
MQSKIVIFLFHYSFRFSFRLYFVKKFQHYNLPVNFSAVINSDNVDSRKGMCATHLTDIEKYFHGAHITINARSALHTDDSFQTRCLGALLNPWWSWPLDGWCLKTRVTRWVCENVAQFVAKPFVRQNESTTDTVEKLSHKICATCVIFKQKPKVNNRPIGEKSPNRRKIAQSGHPAEDPPFF